MRPGIPERVVHSGLYMENSEKCTDVFHAESATLCDFHISPYLGLEYSRYSHKSTGTFPTSGSSLRLPKEPAISISVLVNTVYKELAVIAM